MSKDGMVGDGFGAYLAEAIRRAGYDKPTFFARRAGIDPSVVFRWLSGEQRPTVRLLERVAPVLDIPVPDLVRAAYPTTDHTPAPDQADIAARYTDPETGEVYTDPDERELWDLRRITPADRRELIAFLRTRRAMQPRRRAS